MIMANVSLRLLGRIGHVRCVTGYLATSKLYTSPWRCSVRLNHTEPSSAGFTDYEHERENFKLDVPEYFNFATDVIDKWAEKEKNTSNFRNGNPAFWLVDQPRKKEYQWSFEELAERSKRAANMLKYPGAIKKGDRVLCILPRLPQWWLVNIACMRLGAVLIPGTTLLTAKDIHHRLVRSEAKVIIADENTAAKVDQVVDGCPHLQTKIVVTESIRDSRLGWYNFNDLCQIMDTNNTAEKTRSDDVMTVFFTSGTTGMPKMTEHTYASYGLGCLITGKFWLDLCENDIHWNLSDTGWAKSAWSNIYAPWMQGSCVFIHNTPSFDAKSTLRVLQDYPITTFCTAPTAYRMLVQEIEQNSGTNYQFKTLRHCVSAGEPLNPDVIEAWHKTTGLYLREGYGQTETVLQVGSFRCLPFRAGSMGKPAPGMDVRIIDDDCKEVACGVEGDIAIKVLPERPVGLFTKYYNEAERTARVFKGDYYITGDRAYRDDDGYFWFVGRADDLIISSSYRIGPFEVESALNEHPAVAECAVVGTPDDTRGEVVKAFIVLKENFHGTNKDELTVELQNHVKNTTAPYKYPRKVEYVEYLPKTVSGKIMRKQLRDGVYFRTESDDTEAEKVN